MTYCILTMAITGCKNNDDDDDDAYNLTIKIQSNKYNKHDMIVMIMIDIVKFNSYDLKFACIFVFPK